MVLNHSVNACYDFGLDAVSSMPLRAKIFSFACYTLSRSGVPIFLLLSGYLLLSREYDDKGVCRFYKNNLLSMLLTWEIWIFLYNLFLMWHNGQSFDIGMYLRNALFLQEVQFVHAWYMTMIMGIYLFLPYVANILHKIPDKILLIFMLIVYGYLYIVHSINVFLSAGGLTPIANQLDLSYSGNAYGFYLLLGCCIKRWERQIDQLLGKPRMILGVIGFLSVTYIGTVFMQMALYARQNPYRVRYEFFSIPLISIAWFLLLKNIKLMKAKCFMNQIAKCSFGIYLLHMPILTIVMPWIVKMKDRSAETFVVTTGVYILAFCIVWLLCRIPCCGKILFLYKEKTVGSTGQ